MTVVTLFRKIKLTSKLFSKFLPVALGLSNRDTFNQQCGRRVKKFFYILFLFSMMLVFLGCMDNSDLVDPEIVFKNIETPVSLELVVPENLCVDQKFSIKVNIDKYTSGMLRVMTSSNEGRSWRKTAETTEIKEENIFNLKLRKGSYLFRAEFIGDKYTVLMPSESQTVEREVIECLDCEEILIEPNLTAGSFLVKPGEHITYTVEYSVTVCEEDFSGIKLNGGIIKDAVYKSSSPEGAEVRNNTLYWNIGDTEKGFHKIYSVTFEYNIPDVPSATQIPITSGWTVEGKRADGTAVKTGDYNEIFVQAE
jgi:hypothetical protein